MTTPLGVVLPTADSDHPVRSTLDWKNAKVHIGFVEAYRSMSYAISIKVNDLMKELKRPILLTGHSLGGSLATICTLDLVLRNHTKDIYAATFGSPRCGNFFWRCVHDPIVPAHWRVVIRSNIVTTLLEVGYNHVGKRVALTTSDEIFLDPNAVEILLWSLAGLIISEHRRPKYRNVFVLLCKKYLLDYDPKLFDFVGELDEYDESLSDGAIDTICDIPTTSFD